MPYRQDTIANIGKASLPTLAKCPAAKAPVAAAAKAPVATLQKHPYIYGISKSSFTAPVKAHLRHQ